MPNRCSTPNCGKYAQAQGLCISHGGKKKKYICVVDGCTNGAVFKGKCRKHGGISRCVVDGCNNPKYNQNVCLEHGATRKTCSAPECVNNALQGGVCLRHGAKLKTCRIDGCDKFIQNNEVCVEHGASTKTCGVDECSNKAVKRGFCRRHDPSRRICSEEGCSETIPESDLLNLCKTHRKPSNLCKTDGCMRHIQYRGLCATHGGKRLCSVDGCTRQSQGKGVCVSHGAQTKQCSTPHCDRKAKQGSSCYQHGAVRPKCESSGCSRDSVRDRQCWEHHPAFECIQCHVMHVRIRGDICSVCRVGVPIHVKRRIKEYAMVDAVREAFPEHDWIHDRVVDSKCHLYRPDLHLTLEDRILFIECDENQHMAYECDIPRMFNIAQDVGLPTVFIRWNPDTYSGSEDISTRLSALINRTRCYINTPLPNLKQGVPTIEYMFFDAKTIQNSEDELANRLKELNISS